MTLISKLTDFTDFIKPIIEPEQTQDMEVIKKAVISAASFGTRFLSVTKSQPKEMLPVIDLRNSLSALVLSKTVIIECDHLSVRNFCLLKCRVFLFR